MYFSSYIHEIDLMFNFIISFICLLKPSWCSYTKTFLGILINIFNLIIRNCMQSDAGCIQQIAHH